MAAALDLGARCVSTRASRAARHRTAPVAALRARSRGSHVSPDSVRALDEALDHVAIHGRHEPSDPLAADWSSESAGTADQRLAAMRRLALPAARAALNALAQLQPLFEPHPASVHLDALRAFFRRRRHPTGRRRDRQRARMAREEGRTGHHPGPGGCASPPWRPRCGRAMNSAARSGAGWRPRRSRPAPERPAFSSSTRPPRAIARLRRGAPRRARRRRVAGACRGEICSTRRSCCKGSDGLEDRAAWLRAGRHFSTCCGWRASDARSRRSCSKRTRSSSHRRCSKTAAGGLTAQARRPGRDADISPRGGARRAVADGTSRGHRGRAVARVAPRASSHALAGFHGTSLPHRPRRHSVGALELYAQCPFKYFARHVLKLREEVESTRRASDPRERGIFIHEVFQAFFERWEQGRRRRDHARPI